MRLLRTRGLLFCLDALLLGVTPFLLYVLRFEGLSWPEEHRTTATIFTLVMVPLSLAIFVAFGLYRRLWRYAGIAEVDVMAGAWLTSAVVAGLMGGIVMPALDLVPQRVPISVLFTYGVVLAGIIAVPRLVLRLGIARATGDSRRQKQGRRVLVAGAGAAGVLAIRELRMQPALGLEPVGFVDDDVMKHRQQLGGVPVLGSLSAIPELVEQFQAEIVIIAIPSAPGTVVRRILRAAKEAGAETRTLPSLGEILSGRRTAGALREVQIEDLLRRAPIETDCAAVSELVSGRTVLVTGAGGSIGSELCRQITEMRPSRLLLLGHGENPIFEILNELTPDARCELVPVIADIRDRDRVMRIFAKHDPDVVFHAAAHKHVPLMEENVVEAVTNNVLGTRNIVDAAVAYDTKHFVMISTDKAVRPTNVMGAAKRVAEHVVHNAAIQHGRNFVTVRFGNVLGSQGSVVPTFLRQIRDGGPVTVTHPEMRRYFMTIPEAVQLVLQAGALGHGGELFMLDMGEPVRVLDLARDMIRLSNLEEGVDIEIKFTGARAGEKLTEEMFFSHEVAIPTEHPKILRARNGIEMYCSDPEIASLVERAARGASDEELRKELQSLVPDFHPSSGAPVLPPADAKPRRSSNGKGTRVAADAAAGTPRMVLAIPPGGEEPQLAS